MIDVNELKGWLPVDAVVSDGRPGLVWMDMRGVELAEPFFHQTVAKLRTKQASPEEKFTEFDALLQFEKIADSLQPTGFVFHSSRCGSTLISNALRCVQGSVVLSEAEPIDKLVMRFITDGAESPPKELIYSVLLRALVAALGQKRSHRERRLFIKFSCCSIAQFLRIQRIWPHVPWLFVYRDPVETVVSNLQTMPQWLLDSDHRILASIVGISVAEVDAMQREELCARAIGAFYSLASQLANEHTMLLNYNELSLGTILRVLNFFKVFPTTQEIEAITKTIRVYSKNATAVHYFVDDRKAKAIAVTDSVRESSSEWANDSYQQLETKREQLSGKSDHALFADR